MNALALRFRCPHCQARIRAARALGGKRRACPGCTRPVVVPLPRPADSGPALVFLEQTDLYRLAPAFEP